MATFLWEKMVSSTSQSILDSKGLGFPDRLKQIIGNRSVRSFAHACGLSDAVVRQYLNGRSEPTRPSLLAIARTAQVSLEWLAAGEGSMSSSDNLETLGQTGVEGDFPDRLRQVIGTESIRSFARRCNMSDAVLHQYLSGQSEPTRPALLAIAQGGERSLSWLAAGGSASQSVRSTESQNRSIEKLAGGEILGIHAHNGGAVLALPSSISIMRRQILDQPRNSIAPISELVSEFAAALKIEAENLSFVRMIGDSMKPTIDDGDFFAVDTTETHLLSLAEGIYVFEMNSTIFTRRIAPMIEGGYQAIADNQRYKTFDIHVDESLQHFKVLGRVVWVYRK